MEKSRGLASAGRRVKKCDSWIFVSYLSRDVHPIMRPMESISREQLTAQYQVEAIMSKMASLDDI